MNNKDLANLIFPDIDKDINYYLEKYSSRDLKEGEKVTRFAPSPTGFIHLGGFYQAIIDFVMAKNSNGVFYLRNEDTDTKREVKEATKLIMDTLNHYNIVPDEYEFDGKVVGNYGPYVQSERKEIYHSFIKHLIEIGRAYPCFCSKDDLEELRQKQEGRKFRTGYYGKWAKCRILPVEEQIKRINEGQSYVIRFKSNGNFDHKFKFEDQVKGKLELPENDEDFVIMKSNDKLPTYHFAHIVDDTLMHTTHVVRGEEWLSSLPKHLELFRAFDFKAPKYVHTPLLIKKEGNSVRKISKRKDPEASMIYYKEKGYPTLAVIEALMTIINSNYEAWHDANPDKKFYEFEYSPKKMQSILNERKKLYDLIEYIKHNNPQNKVSQAMKIMKKLLTNITNNPEELKFRIIKTTNQTINNDLMCINGIVDLLHHLGYIATNDGNFLLDANDLNNVNLCLNILNTDVGIFTEQEYVKETSQLMMENPQVKKEMEMKRKKMEEDKRQKERINQLIEADKEERKYKFTYK